MLHFPEPIVIYLDTEKGVPEVSTLTIDFGNQGTFEYQVRNFLYQEHELRELNQKKMIILIPFQILKLKQLMKKGKISEGILQNLILHDILGSIKANLEVGNITEADAEELQELTMELGMHLSQQLEGLEDKDMKKLIEGAMVLPGDKYRDQIEELKVQLEIEKANAERKLQEEKAKAERKLQEERAKAEQEIKMLREQLEQMTK